jgi:hypothetical protein
MDRELRLQSQTRPPVWPCAVSPTIEAMAADVKTQQQGNVLLA